MYFYKLYYHSNDPMTATPSLDPNIFKNFKGK